MKILDKAELLDDKEVVREAKSFLVFILEASKNKDISESQENGDVCIPFSFSLLGEEHKQRLEKVCEFYGIRIIKKLVEYVIIPKDLIKEYTYEQIVDNIKKDFV